MAAPKIRIKRRLTGQPGAPTGMEAGQMAVNFSENKFYISDGTDAVAFGGTGAFVDLSTPQNITAKKTFDGGIETEIVTGLVAPVNPSDATSKEFVENYTQPKTIYASNPPTNPVEFTKWVDSDTMRSYEYIDGAWIQVATF